MGIRSNSITFSLFLGICLATASLSPRPGNTQETSAYGNDGSKYGDSDSVIDPPRPNGYPIVEGTNWVRVERNNAKHTIQPGGWTRIGGLDLVADVDAGPVVAEFCFLAKNTDPDTGPAVVEFGVFIQGVWRGVRVLSVPDEDLGCFSWSGNVSAGIAAGYIYTHCISCAAAWVELDYMVFSAWQ